MRSTPARLGSLSLLILLALTASASADPINWYSAWSATPSEIDADIPSTGKIELIENDTSPLLHAGPSNLVGAQIVALYTGPDTGTATFTSSAFELDLTLKDQASSVSHLFTFTGQFNGSLTALSNLTNATFSGDQTQSYLIGSNLYTVSITSVTPPDVPGAGNVGAIGAQAEVAVSSINSVPEPATLLLAGLGISLGGSYWWRRARRRRHEPQPLLES